MYSRPFTFALFFSLFPVCLLYSDQGRWERSRTYSTPPYDVLTGNLRDPTGITVDDKGTVFVADGKAEFFSGTVFEIREGDLYPLVTRLRRPWGLAWDSEAGLLIVERDKGRLLKLEGEQVSEIAKGIKEPRWITVGEDGAIFVSAQGLKKGRDGDDNNKTDDREHKDKKDTDKDDDGEDDDDDGRDDDQRADQKGEMILRVGETGEKMIWKDGFRELRGVLATKDSIFAAAERHEVIKGKTRPKWGIFEVPILDGIAGKASLLSKTEIKEPHHIVRDSLGAFYVSAEEIEADDRKKQKKGKKKDVIAKVSSDGTVTPFASGLKNPRGLALDIDGDLYVAVEELPKESHSRHRYQKNKKTGGIIRFRAPPASRVDYAFYTNENSLLVSGTTNPNSRLDVFLNGSKTPVRLETEDGSFSFDWKLTSNTENFATVWNTDHYGLWLTSPPTQVKTIHDDLPPTVVFLEPPAEKPVSGTVNIEARASDRGSGIGNFEIRTDGKLLSPVLTPPPPSVSVDATASWDTTTVPDGTYSINASAVDQAGNTQSITHQLLVDNTPPETLISMGPEGTVSGSVFTFTITGTDNLAKPEELQFAWSLDGGPFSTFSPETQISFTNLSAGEHIFEVKALDPAGNETTDLASRTFTVSLLSVQINVPSDGVTVSEGSLLVEGTLHGTEAEVGVSVNGVAAAVHSSTFSVLVPVAPDHSSLTAVAMTSDGIVANQAIAITVLPSIGAQGILHAHPASGVLPLTVEFSLFAGLTSTQVELDSNGDGVADISGTDLQQQTFTYTEPGVYVALARATDGQGNQFTTNAVVQVYEQDALDSLLQAKWTAMKDALRIGDITGALNYLVSSSRSTYEEAFQIIALELPNIDQILTNLSLIRIGNSIAVYEATRVDDGLNMSFEVRFAIDEDGIWRLEAF